jgi:hypothetical protein
MRPHVRRHRLPVMTALCAAIVVFAATGARADEQYHPDFLPGDGPSHESYFSVTFGPETILTMELGGTTPGTQYDQMFVTEVAELNGTLVITLIDGFRPHHADVFVVLEAGAVEGLFERIELPETLPDSWELVQTSTTFEIHTVPEPVGLPALLLAGAFVLARRGRR